MSYTVPSTKVRREGERRFLEGVPPFYFTQTQLITVRTGGQTGIC